MSHDKHDTSGGAGMLLLLLVLIGVGAALAVNARDIQRYLRLRNM